MNPLEARGMGIAHAGKAVGTLPAFLYLPIEGGSPPDMVDQLWKPTVEEMSRDEILCVF
jgi:hypothetical protein